MRLVGQTELAEFLRENVHGRDLIQAWLAEMRHGNWKDAVALKGDFRNVDISALPAVIFQIPGAGAQIETLINFRLGLIALVSVQASSPLRSAIRSLA